MTSPNESTTIPAPNVVTKVCMGCLDVIDLAIPAVGDVFIIATPDDCDVCEGDGCTGPGCEICKEL